MRVFLTSILSLAFRSKSYLVAILLVCSMTAAFATTDDERRVPVKVALLADVHLQDIYGELSDSDYRGVKNPATGRMTLARTMGAQLLSTRLFNENYFAFLAALDDIVERDIAYVVMPGDFSDDGQPLNIRGLKQILEQYRDKHGLQFILTTGNHDPVRPYTIEAGKRDFLGKGGRMQAIASQPDFYENLNADDLPLIVSDDIKKLGYSDILDSLGAFGFFPQKNDLYWESPFSNYEYDSYSYNKAKVQSSLKHRRYEITQGFTVPDVSYLLEPEEGLWFLAIDANVYIPQATQDTDASDGNSYGSASTGYNNTLVYKPHLFDWVASVMERAERLGKQVVVFSHYPVLEFNDGASAHMHALFGEGKMQLHRVPKEEIAKRFHNAGVRLHFGGHMHINDTSVLPFSDGTSLVNIQVPSLAAYIPAYKIASFSDEKVDIKTIVIDDVPRFQELFPLYEMEYNYLRKNSPKTIWDREILNAKNYREFTQWHLRELVRQRFLKKDWPERLKTFLLDAKGSDLLHFSGKVVVENKDDAFAWTGFDMIFDFYRLRSADQLALVDVTQNRLAEYRVVVQALLDMGEKENQIEALEEDLKQFSQIFLHFMDGAPAADFSVNIENGHVYDTP